MWYRQWWLFQSVPRPHATWSFFCHSIGSGNPARKYLSQQTINKASKRRLHLGHERSPRPLSRRPNPFRILSRPRHGGSGPRSRAVLGKRQQRAKPPKLTRLTRYRPQRRLPRQSSRVWLGLEGLRSYGLRHRGWRSYLARRYKPLFAQNSGRHLQRYQRQRSNLGFLQKTLNLKS